MAFPLCLEDLNEEEKNQIYNETLIEPQSESSIPASVLASLPPSAAGMLNKIGPPFSFFNILPEKKQISLPFYYARQLLGEDVVPGDDNDGNGDAVWHKFSNPDFLNGDKRIELRDYQKTVVKDALSQLQKHGTTTIILPPGKGKTIIGVCLASLLQLKTAYIFPSNISSLTGQWVTTHEKVFPNVNPDDLKQQYMIFPPMPSLSGKFPWEKVADEFNFILTPDSRVSAIPDSIAKKIGTLVIDEGHLLCTKSRVQALLRFSPKYIIVLTATPERSDGSHRMLSLLAGPHCIFEKASAAFSVIKKKVDISIPEKMSPHSGTLDYTSFCSDLSKSVEYNNAIVEEVIINVTENNRKIIVLTKLVDHVKELANLIFEKSNGTIKCETMFGKKKTHFDTKVLIGTTQKVSTGYDAATAVEDFNGISVDTLILTHGVKQWQNFEQSKGRIMRSGAENPPLIIWMCTRNNILCRHLSGLKKYIESTGGTIK